MQLAPGDVDLFVATPETIPCDILAQYDALLNEAERGRRDAFAFERHRVEFLVTRALVRTSLSCFRAIAPADWCFDENEHGCPRIAPPCGLEFNLSNHRTMVVCAVTEGTAIGVDVEPLSRAPQIIELAPNVFAPSELAALNALSTADRNDRAVALWTAKEAYIKARGMGLALPLDGFAFHFDTTEPRSPTITFTRAIADDPARWWFRSVDVDGHRVTVAIASRDLKIGRPQLRVRRSTPLVRIEDRG